jgi:hypothetical protein
MAGVFVNRSRDDLLSGAGFAEDEDRGAAAGDDAGARHDGGEAGVRANQALFVEPRAVLEQVLRDSGCSAGNLLVL